jgi:hypothetical protein
MNPHCGVFDRAVHGELPVSQLQTSLDHGAIAGHVTDLEVAFEGELVSQRRQI